MWSLCDLGLRIDEVSVELLAAHEMLDFFVELQLLIGTSLHVVGRACNRHIVRLLLFNIHNYYLIHHIKHTITNVDS